MARAEEAQLVEKFETFLRRYYKEDVLKLAQEPNDRGALYVDWHDLLKFHEKAAEGALTDPEDVQETLEEALARYDNPADADLSGVNVRFANINSDRVYDVGKYNEQNVTDLIGVRGQVTQLTDPKPKLEEAEWVCQHCGTPTRVPQAGMEPQEPHECPGCERGGPFKLNIDNSSFVDFQMARVKLPPEKSNGGDSKVDVHMFDDMVGDLEGNERIEINGKLSLDTDELNSTVFDYQLDTRVGSITVTEGGYDDVDIDDHLEAIQEIAAEDDPVGKLADNLADLHATDKLESVLEAAVLQLVGAGRKDPENGPTFRGDFHMLLLGDPGGGKSQLLDAVEEVAPRAKSASGKGLSKAGATAAAVRNDFGPQEWTLEAGLMVLANEGIACLDEIDKVDPDAVSSLHSALERQRVDVVKAGIDANLPARTSLLAAGNPKGGRFDKDVPVADQIDLEPSLMSRFDLMFMIRDAPDVEQDRKIAEYVAEAWDTAAKVEYDKTDGNEDDWRDVPAEVFQAYIAYARERVFPVIDNPEVFNRIIDHYVNVREKGTDENSPVPITARKLEAFFRLSEASARARLSETVELEDADRAIRLIMESLRDVGIDPESGELDVDIIETGQSKSQRDNAKAVKATIMDVAEENENGAPIDKVLDLAEDIGIPRDKAEHEIEKLKQKGEVYEPNTDHLRTS